jgi:hypothetical protein
MTHDDGSGLGETFCLNRDGGRRHVMSQYQALMNPETKMPIKCPMQRDASCNNHCAWFDGANRQCSVLTVAGALAKLAQASESGQATPTIR